MRVLMIGLALLAATALYADDEKDKKDKGKSDWQKVSPKGSKIETMFPGKPKLDETKNRTEYLLETMDKKAAYMLMITPLGEKVDLDKEELVTKMLDKGRDGAVTELKGKLKADKAVKVGKFPGRAIDVEAAPELGLYRSRFYLTPTHMVQVAVFGPKEFAEGKDATKFLDSLKIGE